MRPLAEITADARMAITEPAREVVRSVGESVTLVFPAIDGPSAAEWNHLFDEVGRLEARETALLEANNESLDKYRTAKRERDEAISGIHAAARFILSMEKLVRGAAQQ